MRFYNIGLMLITAVALILAFPPFWGGAIAMVALIPLYYFIEGKTPWKAFFGGYLIGMIWAAGTLYWIGWATLTGLIGVIIVLPIFLGLFSGLLSWMIQTWGQRALWFAPFIWIGMEVIQSVGEIGFPWNQLAYTQTNLIPFIQFASIFGALGISFWVVCINVLVFMLIHCFGKNRSTVKLLILLFLMVLIPWIHGKVVLSRADINQKSNLNISLVQGNIDPYKKWTPSFVDSNFVVYQRLTYQTKPTGPDLIIWPETATPCYLRYRFHYLSKVRTIADSLMVSILTGSPDYEWNKKGEAITYNAALLIQPRKSRVQRYYKKHLVPFSERVPGIDKLPFLYQWLSRLNLDVGNYTPGDSSYVFQAKSKRLKQYRFGTAICYDSVFPYYIRELVQKGAQFVIIITNDGWFGNTSGPYQHAGVAKLRAIEVRRWIARCANTGISGFIDPWGRYQQKSTFNQEAVLHQSIFFMEDETLFMRYGNHYRTLILLFNLFIVMVTFIKRIKNKLSS